NSCFCPTIVKLDPDGLVYNQWIYGSAEFNTNRSQQLFITADDQLIMTNVAQSGLEYFQWILEVNTDGTVENQHSIQVYNPNLERRVLSELYNDQEMLLSGISNENGISSLIRYNLATEEIKTSFENPIPADEDHTIFLLNDGRIGLIYDPVDYDFLRVLVREPDGTTCYTREIDFYNSPETEVAFQRGNGQIYIGGLTRDWMQSFASVFTIDDQPCTTVSTQDFTLTELVELAPNPSRTSFTVTFSESASRNVNLYNQQGQVVFQGQTQNTQVEIPTVDLSNGTYLLRIQEESGVVHTEKVAVLH
ncbi:MAG: T9SS type A sorting domain-containing protein, partial [Bacteroidota bacterium]